jgi:hypothetical protein
MKFEDVSGTVFTTYPDFTNFACESNTENSGILTICSNISYFQIAGLVYLILATILLLCIIFSMLNLIMKIVGKNNWVTDTLFTHYTNTVLAIVAGGSYLLISNVDNL